MQPGQTSGYGRGEAVAYSSGSANPAAGSSSVAGTAGSGLVGAVGSPGDRIQLAPLRAHSHGGNVTPPLVPLSYPLSQRGSGSSQSMYASERATTEMSRGELRNIGESLRGGGGKKNPLSIGNIIDDETR